MAVDGRHESAAVLALFVGVLAVAVIASLALIRTRREAGAREAALAAELAALRAQVDRSAVMLAAEPQVIVAWSGDDEEPSVAGDLSKVGLPAGRRVLGFGSWLPPEQAGALERAVMALRQRGEAFRMALKSQRGIHVEAEGRPVAGQVVLRLRDVTGDKLAAAALAESEATLKAELTDLHRLLDLVPCPIWQRDALGRLAYVNAAFAKAVDAGESATAVARQVELIENQARDEAAAARRLGQPFQARLPVVVAGERRTCDVLDAPLPSGSGGIAVDVSELETVRADLGRQMEAHRRTLDELATAVAIFRADGTLVFYNQAYRALWQLDAAFLDQGPTDSDILDRLRANRLLPEQADFRSWRESLFEAYRAIQPREHWWHLPRGRRTLRVVQTPNPEGGVTYLFDDVTEKLDLEQRFNALIRVQSETLDHLRDGVAVFASDGRLALYNPAFVKLWKLGAEVVSERPHIEEIVRLARVLHDDGRFWQGLIGAITALPPDRAPFDARIERADGSVLEVGTVPLPDGATLVVFGDVSAAATMERALRERNEALEAASQLKNDFVKHVSYELRSPLTNIIGFTQLLGDGRVGPLNEKQQDYAGHILASSAALLAIINDILDLATIDAGAMELELAEVDIRATMNAAAEGVRDRLREQNIALEIVAPSSIGRFVADGARLRQVLYNLLSNAIGFSEPGGRIRLEAERRADQVVFRVRDEGRGIPPELRGKVFDRFESHTAGSRHRGVGLGLSIVRSLVELHGGQVELESAPGRGTTVTCMLPLETSSRRAA